ncbi:MAG: 4Fe-4S binding protein [Bacteroidales bacterium]|nr:4Fe-4S binding protein [Bacteroidales bacterium]MCF8327776.1 4Fe-4S binding protein [Bacteroidales bacterium]
MKQVTIISGKGGTGKTSITAALAANQGNAIFTDCDVDAADLYLLLTPNIQKTHTFPGAPIAQIDQQKCTSCGICESLCRFDAIQQKDGVFQVVEFNCEGCKLCMHACPANAISMQQPENSEWYESDTRFGPMIHAHLGIGEDLSGKLVSQLRERAREVAKERNAGLILTDGPPGVGCPVIASITGADLGVVITEPTMSGLNDLKRVVDLAEYFHIPLKVVVNKYDLNKSMTDKIEKYCQESNLELIARIPYDKIFLEAMVEQKTLSEYAPENSINDIIQDIHKAIQ